MRKRTCYPGTVRLDDTAESPYKNLFDRREPSEESEAKPEGREDRNGEKGGGTETAGPKAPECVEPSSAVPIQNPGPWEPDSEAPVEKTAADLKQAVRVKSLERLYPECRDVILTFATPNVTSRVKTMLLSLRHAGWTGLLRVVNYGNAIDLTGIPEPIEHRIIETEWWRRSVVSESKKRPWLNKLVMDQHVFEGERVLYTDGSDVLFYRNPKELFASLDNLDFIVIKSDHEKTVEIPGLDRLFAIQQCKHEFCHGGLQVFNVNQRFFAFWTLVKACYGWACTTAVGSDQEAMNLALCLSPDLSIGYADPAWITIAKRNKGRKIINGIFYTHDHRKILALHDAGPEKNHFNQTDIDLALRQGEYAKRF